MNQLFKEEPPYMCLLTILDNYADKDKDKYIIDYVTYKRIIFHKAHVDWLQHLCEYYHKSKQFYATRPFKFTSFITIIRHLCKIHNKPYGYNYDRNQNYQHLKYFIKI